MKIREYLNEKRKLTLKTDDEVLEYEDEIVGLFKYKRYGKMGGNGPGMAIDEWIKENNISLGPKVDIDRVIRKMSWV